MIWNLCLQSSLLCHLAVDLWTCYYLRRSVGVPPMLWATVQGHLTHLLLRLTPWAMECWSDPPVPFAGPHPRCRVCVATCSVVVLEGAFFFFSSLLLALFVLFSNLSLQRKTNPLTPGGPTEWNPVQWDLVTALPFSGHWSVPLAPVTCMPWFMS